MAWKLAVAAAMAGMFFGVTAWGQTQPAAANPAKMAFKAQKLGETTGSTVVAKFKDGKDCCFLLQFDDSCPSHLKNAIPELEKRGLVGTFYIVPGGAVHKNNEAAWKKAAKSPAVVLANHTNLHNNLETVEQLDEQLKKCNEAIDAMTPEVKQPRLYSFGQPGGVKWGVTKEQISEELVKNNLINRPPFWGPPMHYKGVDGVVAILETAMKKGEMGHVDFHGVGGDWLVTPMEWYIPLLDKLVENKDKVWVTDPLSWHKYICERNTVAIKLTENTEKKICVQVSSAMDVKLYDMPLTLTTRVPAGWKGAVVVQGKSEKKVEVKEGVVMYEAMPGDVVVEIKKGE